MKETRYSESWSGCLLYWSEAACAGRQVLRAEEEKRLAAAKKVEDERRLREQEEKKQRELEEKRRRLEEAEKKRQLLEQASKATAGGKIKISKSGDQVGQVARREEL